MLFYLGLLLVIGLIVTQCSAAVDTYTQKVITILKNQLDQQNLVDLFKRGGSLDPSVSTILQILPNAEISAFTCFITKMNGAMNAANDNSGNIFDVVVYYKGVCNSDANLNKVMDVLTDKQTQLKAVVTKMVNGIIPAQVRPVALALIGQSFSNQAITLAQANNYVKTVKSMSTATKNALFARVPSLKSVLNPAGVYYKPFNVLLTNLPTLISNKAPTGTVKTNINAALVKMYDYGHKNAGEWIQAAIKWIKAQPIAASQNVDPALTAYRQGSLKLITNLKMALAVPMTQETIQNFLKNPYQFP